MVERLKSGRMVTVPRFTRRSWIFAAVLALGLGAGSGIVPAAAQTGGDSPIALLPLAPGELEIPFILPPVTAVGSTSADSDGLGATSSTGVSVVIDGDMFGVK
jgi:hypothetical protein